ncbi:hypothetical protein TPAU25S_00898 [Tsukamurella paurometabola]
MTLATLAIGTGCGGAERADAPRRCRLSGRRPRDVGLAALEGVAVLGGEFERGRGKRTDVLYDPPKTITSRRTSGVQIFTRRTAVRAAAGCWSAPRAGSAAAWASPGACVVRSGPDLRRWWPRGAVIGGWWRRRRRGLRTAGSSKSFERDELAGPLGLGLGLGLGAGARVAQPRSTWRAGRRRASGSGSSGGRLIDRERLGRPGCVVRTPLPRPPLLSSGPRPRRHHDRPAPAPTRRHPRPRTHRARPDCPETPAPPIPWRPPGGVPGTVLAGGAAVFGVLPGVLARPRPRPRGRPRRSPPAEVPARASSEALPRLRCPSRASWEARPSGRSAPPVPSDPGARHRARTGALGVTVGQVRPSCLGSGVRRPCPGVLGGVIIGEARPSRPRGRRLPPCPHRPRRRRCLRGGRAGWYRCPRRRRSSAWASPASSVPASSGVAAPSASRSPRGAAPGGSRPGRRRPPPPGQPQRGRCRARLPSGLALQVLVRLGRADPRGDGLTQPALTPLRRATLAHGRRAALAPGRRAALAPGRRAALALRRVLPSPSAETRRAPTATPGGRVRGAAGSVAGGFATAGSGIPLPLVPAPALPPSASADSTCAASTCRGTRPPPMPPPCAARPACAILNRVYRPPARASVALSEPCTSVLCAGLPRGRRERHTYRFPYGTGHVPSTDQCERGHPVLTVSTRGGMDGAGAAEHFRRSFCCWCAGPDHGYHCTAAVARPRSGRQRS